MLLILPIIFLVALFLILRHKGVDWRRAALGSTVMCGTAVVVITETLSLPHLLGRFGVALFWLGLCSASLLYLNILKRQSLSVNSDYQERRDSLGTPDRGLLAGAGVIVFLVGVTALISAPNTWDAMEYHLPRVTMWMSNHSVRLFATPDYAQLIFGPWAEYAMMHTDLLSGSDRFVNMVEFVSMLGSLIGVSLIAKMLGAGPRGQVLAAVTCVTIPEGILEASGPMNTYVVSFWIVTTVVFLMSWSESQTWFHSVCIGLSAALAILTKGSAYVYLPFLVLVCWWMGSRAARLRFLKHSAVIVLLILAVNAPQFVRSYQLTGSPLGMPFPDAGPAFHWMVDRVSPPETAANVLRNVSLHLVTPIPSVNARIERSIRFAIGSLGQDPDDPKAIWPTSGFFVSDHLSLHEVHAGNPVHLALVVASMFLVFIRAKDTQFRRGAWYAAGIAGAFILFCALLRWQEWGARHHLPLFVLGAALVGFTLEKCFSRRFAVAVAMGLLLCALPFALLNRTRSFVPWNKVADVYHSRADLYFSDMHQKVAQSYSAAADYVNRIDCSSVAIDSYYEGSASQRNRSPKSFYVYPFFALIHANGRTRTVTYTGVRNLSARYAVATQSPSRCAVVCMDCVNAPEKWQEYRSAGLTASVFGDIVIFSSVPANSR